MQNEPTLEEKIDALRKWLQALDDLYTSLQSRVINLEDNFLKFKISKS
jgi:hypothetical protein